MSSFVGTDESKPTASLGEEERIETRGARPDDQVAAPSPGNRKTFVERLKQYVEINLATAAVITVDLHRGHLDPAVATMPVAPEQAERVVARTTRLLALARAIPVPVIHVILTRRPVEARNPKPHRRAVLLAREALLPHGSEDLLGHNLSGSVQTQLHPSLGPGPNDLIIDNKKTFSAFLGTDLDHLLRLLKVETLLVAGVNTNTCVLNTCFDAHNLGYAPVVISDCVASMYGDDLHHFALQNISRCMGWVLSLEELERKVVESRPGLQRRTSEIGGNTPRRREEGDVDEYPLAWP